jgi:hypothetical protein
MTSFANVSTALMELTPCQVFFTPPGTTGEIDLGGTLGNVTVKAKYFKAEIKADQSADTIRDRRTAGVEVTVATEITQTKNKDLWKIVFPHASEVTGGTKAIDFIQSVGDSDLDNSGKLRLHPLSAASGDITRDLTFFKATANADSELVFSPKDQQKLPITWNVLPDDSGGQPEKFFRYGDIGL